MMDAASRNTRRPATRLDVQRHHLEDIRTRYARQNVDARGDRENHLLATIRAIRMSVVNLLVSEGRRTHQEPVAALEPISESTNTAVSAP